MKPSVFFHRGTEWDGTVRGSTNIIARHFLNAGYPVTWMTRPIHLGHLLLRSKNKNVQLYKKRFMRASDGALVFCPLTLVPRLQRYITEQHVWAALSKWGYRTTYPSLRRILHEAGQPEPQIIWTTGGDGGALRSYFPKAIRIVQCVDVYEAYAGSRQNLLEVQDYRDADAVVSIGHALADFLHKERGVPTDKITVIGQGVDQDLFDIEHPEPEDLRSLPRPRLIWVGVLAKADPELIEAAANALPAGKGSIVLIGPPMEWALNMAKRNHRIHVLGARKPEVVPGYLKHSDIGLMLYNRNADSLVYQGQNPLKLYEMAAASLPILSTPHAEYKYLKPPVLIVQSREDISLQLEIALQKSDILKCKTRHFAKDNSWKKRFKESEELILNILKT